MKVQMCKSSLSQYFNRSASWLCENLFELRLEGSLDKHPTYLQLLGELAVLVIFCTQSDAVCGTIRRRISNCFEAEIDFYTSNFPYKTDPKLFRLTNLLSCATSRECVRKALQTPQLRELALIQFFSKERTPWEILTIKFSESPLSTSQHDGLPSEEELVSTSLLLYTCPPQMLTRLGYYAVTHIVFFSTRFGKVKPKEIFRNTDKVIHRLHELLNFMLLADEADICAEIILALICMGEPLVGLHDQFDLVLKKIDLASLFHTDLQADRKHIFWPKYHTLLVTLLIVALSLECENDR